ncbi:MAG: carbon monoxide dehydrogenase subunit G [Pseudomonadota bacterium]
MTGEFELPAPREAVWAALNDPEVLKRCIPGCEAIEQRSETELDAQMSAKIGPVKSRFATSIELADVNPPESYTLIGQGKGGAAGFAKGQAKVSLAGSAAGTVLSYEVEMQVGGKLAQIGSRLVAGAARKIADQFFTAFEAEFAQDS